MDTQELLNILAHGEDSRHQFKRKITHLDSLTAEMAAFSNNGGGRMFIGVDGYLARSVTAIIVQCPASTSIGFACRNEVR